MTRPAGALALAVVIGAGLATGLAHFPDPLSVAVALGVGAVLTRQPAHLALAAAGITAILAAGLVRDHADRSCAARLPLGEQQFLVRTIDPGHRAGRVSLPGIDCGGTVLARWPATVAIPAGSQVAVTARWLPRAGRLGRPDGMLLIRRSTAAVGSPTLVDRSRNAVAASTARLFGDRAGLVDAGFAGRLGGLEPAVRDRFGAAGMVHLLAISGFHVGLLAGWILLLLRVTGLRPARAGPLAALVVLGYAAWLGWPPPATRAAALVATAVLARHRQRSARSDGLIGASALVVLLVDPWSIVDLGAWLSFAAVVGVFRAVQWSRRAFGGHTAWRDAIAASIGATLATAPLAALLIGRVAIIGPIVNLVAIPLVAITIPALLLSIAITAIAPMSAHAFAASGGMLLGLVDRLALVASGLPGAAGPADPGWRSAAPWLAVLVLAWIATRNDASPAEAIRRAGWGCVVLLWWPLATGLSSDPIAGGPVALHFLDVGQGDAAAIRTPGGHWVIVDTGPGDERFDAGSRVVTPFLERAGATRITMLVVSHPHRDHVGGAAALVDRWPIDIALDPGEPFDDQRYLAWLELLASHRVRWRTGARGLAWTIDGVGFRVLHPAPGWPGAGRDLNEDSIVLEVRYGEFTALLGGDAGLPAEAAFLPLLGTVDLLKVGHHGSRGATGEALLRQVRPRVAVVSVGRNRYGHPSVEALDRLAEAGTRVVRTDREGTITVVTDGETFTVRGGRTASTHDARNPTSEALPCCTRPR